LSVIHFSREASLILTESRGWVKVEYFLKAHVLFWDSDPLTVQDAEKRNGERTGRIWHHRSLSNADLHCSGVCCEERAQRGLFLALTFLDLQRGKLSGVTSEEVQIPLGKDLWEAAL
jgi:hypothetical protein